ncbi:MAG: hypothetical protein NTW28_19140 [Candidatus Solibacter sp.]|nr:hypothetical protein [Candidatus Solibacter sp.]
MWACVGLLSLTGQALAASGSPDYRFKSKISRQVLEHYLARSITMAELYRSPGNLDDDLRMLRSTGAKFIGRAIYLWGGEARIVESDFLAQGRELTRRIHRADTDVVVQAAAFEIVTEAVAKVPVPAWVFREFGLAPEKRNFSYQKMLFPDGKMVNHWRQGQSVPDICQMETKMWFVFLVGTYLDIGVEAIHLGQLDLMGRNDPQYRNWAELMQHVRRYAAKKARRKFVIFDAHVPKAGPVVDGRLLLDFHSFPLRPKEVAETPQKAVLAGGYTDGGTRAPGQSSQSPRPSIFTWGFDEITWFARQPESYRNEWLSYAWKWLKEHDPNGFLQMPGSRMLTNGPPVAGEGGGSQRWYFANTKSAACPQGFGQEETIKAIWAEDVRR